MFHNEAVAERGVAAFYATIYSDLIEKARQCGWALGLHGSLAHDMDIMAMPWTEEATSAEEMIKALASCFMDNPIMKTEPYYGKPNNRVVYTLNICGSFYMDINVIDSIKPRKKG